jgi:DNA-binding transcriptional LysR family regulator
MLEANDQMLLLGGAAVGPQPIRLGINSSFAKEFFENQNADTLADVIIQIDGSTSIAKGLLEGYIDIACIFESPEIDSEIADFGVKEFDEPFVWVRSKNFVLRPGAPIPILTSGGDDLMIRTLTRHGLQYRVVFNSADFHAKMSAVAAGIGVTAIPERLMPPFLIPAREYYLPKLPTAKALLCARSGLEGPAASALIHRLSGLFFDHRSAPFASKVAS